MSVQFYYYGYVAFMMFTEINEKEGNELLLCFAVVTGMRKIPDKVSS